MSEHLNRVSKAYIKYKQKRETIKRRHREALKQASLDKLIELGEVIQDARDAGFKVEEIMAVIGLKNRNFMYDAIRAYNDYKHQEDFEGLEQEQKEEQELGEFATKIEKLDPHTVRVTIGDSTHTTSVVNGVMTSVPDEWIIHENPEFRRALKEVVLNLSAEF